jgi:hypothetical protein
MLRMKVELPAHRAAAAMLTVAFEICKDGHHSRGETWSDAQVKDEIRKIYEDFLGITDPQFGNQMAQQAVQRPQRPKP